MGDMLDRVASAALVAMHPEGVAVSLAENGRVIVSPQMFEHARTVARAAIQAMRDPTEEMVREGEKEMFEWMAESADWTLATTRCAWQTMIDEALK